MEVGLGEISRDLQDFFILFNVNDGVTENLRGTSRRMLSSGNSARRPEAMSFVDFFSCSNYNMPTLMPSILSLENIDVMWNQPVKECQPSPAQELKTMIDDVDMKESPD